MYLVYHVINIYSLSKFLRKSILKLKPSVTNKSVKLQCHAYNEYGHTSQIKMTKPREIKHGGRHLKGLRSNKGNTYFKLLLSNS